MARRIERETSQKISGPIVLWRWGSLGASSNIQTKNIKGVIILRWWSLPLWLLPLWNHLFIIVQERGHFILGLLFFGHNRLAFKVHNAFPWGLSLLVSHPDLGLLKRSLNNMLIIVDVEFFRHFN